MATSCVGAVVIGRNEGDRLRACLESVLPQTRYSVYVDSGSTDGSAALARRMGVHSIELSAARRFTAGRGRNAGWRRVVERNPEVQFVQFVDGDCVLDPSWVNTAVAEFDSHPEAAIILGHVRETRPRRNIYHRLASLEWDTPTGVSKYCGGIAMCRASALAQVNGFRDELVGGEEPELCVRLRQAGWSILKLDREMALHDSDIDSFGKWWRRSVRNGLSYAEGAALHGAFPERHWVKEARSIWIWGIAIPLIGLCLVWPTRGISVAVMIAMYLALVSKITINRLFAHKYSTADALLYAAFCVAGKWPQAIGMCRYYFRVAGISSSPFC